MTSHKNNNLQGEIEMSFSGRGLLKGWVASAALGSTPIIFLMRSYECPA
jgi:hypothetical protein